MKKDEFMKTLAGMDQDELIRMYLTAQEQKKQGVFEGETDTNRTAQIKRDMQNIKPR